MPECFVIMPLTTPSEAAEEFYGGDTDHFGNVLENLFVPAIEAAGFTPKRPIAEGSDLIHAEIVRNLETAELVLCDISVLNANVFFELGIRTALDRPICLVRDAHTTLPFDVAGLNCHTYAPGIWTLAKEVTRLAEHLTTTAKRADGHNALWRHFGLTQRGTDAINSAPDDGQGAAMKLILDEIQQIRREIAQSDPEYGPDLGSGIRPLDLFYRDAQSVFSQHGVGVRRFSYDFDENTIDFQATKQWPEEVRPALAQLAAMYGIRVSFS